MYRITWKGELSDRKYHGPDDFPDWDSCQRECEKMDGKYPTVRHWPERV